MRNIYTVYTGQIGEEEGKMIQIRRGISLSINDRMSESLNHCDIRFKVGLATVKRKSSKLWREQAAEPHILTTYPHNVRGVCAYK